MALTPEDVVNKRFQPTKFREGYDQDEVDDFLDEVVVELRRLNRENEELRSRLVAGGAEQGTPSGSESGRAASSSCPPTPRTPTPPPRSSWGAPSSPRCVSGRPRSPSAGGS